MSVSSTLTKKRITNGVYEGIYTSANSTTTAPEVELTLLGQPVGEVFVDQIDEKNNTWLIRCKIPADIISDGVHSFLICEQGRTDVLDHFSIIAGDPLDDDLRNEINLLREELDMLKRAFRRHCVETLG
jgi:hypothetical protein